KPISFTLWKYVPNSFTTHEDLLFFWNEKPLEFKRTRTIIESWKYDTRKTITGEIGVQGNERFNSPVPKIFHLELDKGGSELITDNVIHPLKVEGVPDELVYALWSITVGNRAIVSHPIYVDNAYTHLPDFQREETNEILAYSLIYSIITDMKNNYTNGRIGFFGDEKEFKFGGKKLTEGSIYLLKKHGSCKIGKTAIGELFLKLRNLTDMDELDDKTRSEIREEIAKRLDSINYWGYIPLPRKKKQQIGLTSFFN
ncbi:MAG: hypothetical protein ACFFD4_38560, partial [Candidatus Odinarchaeota archaeon]